LKIETNVSCIQFNYRWHILQAIWKKLFPKGQIFRDFILALKERSSAKFKFHSRNFFQSSQGKMLSSCFGKFLKLFQFFSENPFEMIHEMSYKLFKKLKITQCQFKLIALVELKKVKRKIDPNLEISSTAKMWMHNMLKRKRPQNITCHS
jgi:hypothetical protein